MKKSIVVIGIGEMAGVFSRGFLRLGHPVIPVTRDMDMGEVAGAVTSPELVLLTVGERDLHPVLEKIPTIWRDRLVLLQNELLPRDWEAHGLESVTAVAVWFEKKKGQDYKVLVPSPAYGPHAAVIESALKTLEIPVRELDNEDQLVFELVRKNLYILTTNIAGMELEPGTSVDTLWTDHRDLAGRVADEVLDIQFRLVNRELDRESLLTGMVEAIEGDPNHQCTGRSAPARLARAIEHADKFGETVPKLREIHDRHIS
ncbi:NAD(P)-binding domain-containing protein [Thiohalomonas denitrificans]|uniref:Ketopantoate reductase n=1 Tax=Thiohalomonas denitrificans TaxID=415747 RepID=A0A1G5PNV8_9GAMM|nr:hypothetical protein [Thiohalomonas denitrificans]SCZ50759.1 hypothetical protein SAMN03097708_00492 [Thiohalomonas denitrificans]